jgi:hypothetical protein
LQATAHEDLKRLLSKAQAVDELESTIPSFIEKTMHKNYPSYVHVLRVRPSACAVRSCCRNVTMLCSAKAAAL